MNSKNRINVSILCTVVIHMQDIGRTAHPTRQSRKACKVCMYKHVHCTCIIYAYTCTLTVASVESTSSPFIIRTASKRYDKYSSVRVHKHIHVYTRT